MDKLDKFYLNMFYCYIYNLYFVHKKPKEIYEDGTFENCNNLEMKFRLRLKLASLVHNIIKIIEFLVLNLTIILFSISLEVTLFLKNIWTRLNIIITLILVQLVIMFYIIFKSIWNILENKKYIDRIKNENIGILDNTINPIRIDECR